MSLERCYLMPHPPIMIPEVGGKEINKVAATIEAAKRVGREIQKISPDTIIIISPHGPVFSDAICIYDFPLKGDLASFRAPEVTLNFKSDPELLKEIIQLSKEHKIPAISSRKIHISRFGLKEEIDHGVMIPMYFIDKFAKGFQLLPLAFGMLSYEKLYRFGKLLNKAAKNVNRKIVIIASGDLSHRLTPEAPAGYSPQGKIFDEKLIKALKDWNLEELSSFDKTLIEKAGECGLRSIWTMAGALDGYEVKPEIYSYEGPFGVGYCVASFLPREKVVNPYISLAQNVLEKHIKEGKELEITKDLPKEMLEKQAGVFVTIKKHGQLRGCIGTIFPTQENIATEIARNAIGAALQDPRFPPITREELPFLEYSVDVLTCPEPVDSIEKLNPKEYGIIVKKGIRRGVLLPDLEGVDTVNEQLNIALQKAGIHPKESYEIERFKVIRHN